MSPAAAASTSEKLALLPLRRHGAAGAGVFISLAILSKPFIAPAKTWRTLVGSGGAYAGAAAAAAASSVASTTDTGAADAGWGTVADDISNAGRWKTADLNNRSRSNNIFFELKIRFWGFY